MLTKYKALCHECGLTIETASQFLDIRESTSKSLWLGTKEMNQGIATELLSLADRIKNESERLKTAIDSALSKGKTVKIRLPIDDNEALASGWHCLGCYEKAVAKALSCCNGATLAAIELVRVEREGTENR